MAYENAIRTDLQKAADRLLEARAVAMDRQRTSLHGPTLVHTLAEVDYLNDGGSTFLDASLRSLAELQRPAVWIAGAPLAERLPRFLDELRRRRVVAVVFHGTVEAAVLEPLRDAIGDVFDAGDVRTATFLARELATEGKVVLFSPGCPSAPQYANYEERAAEFIRAVNDL